MITITDLVTQFTRVTSASFMTINPSEYAALGPTGYSASFNGGARARVWGSAAKTLDSAARLTP